MAINVSQAFHRTSANPIDDSIALTKAGMVAVNDNLMPNKYLTVCQDDGKIYLYDKANTVDANTGRFRVLEVEVDSALSSISENPVQNKVIKTALDNKADLDNGKIPASQLPSYVDDVIEGYYNSTDGKFYEESTYETEIPGEAGKSYVDKAENKSYRWTGSAFVRVDEGVQLGETNATAYRGDRGKTAYDISQTVGDVDNLQTTEKDTIVGAINEARVFDNIANRPELPADLSNIIDELPNGATVKSCVPMNNKFNRADIYSTTEKIVGAWYDGRPLYQKTIDCGTLSSTGKNTAHNISNLDKVVFAYGMVTSADGNRTQPIPWINNSAQNPICYNINKTNISIEYTAAWDGQSAIVTLQYTKTTDTAGSFNPSTETDYSTNETVIGTWIDGKPIYQKVFTMEVTTVNTQAFDFIDTSTLNIDECVDLRGYQKVKSANNTTMSYKDIPYTYANPEVTPTQFCMMTMQKAITNEGFNRLAVNYCIPVASTLYIIAQYTKTTD